MFFIIGTIVVLVCVFGGYKAADGHLDVLWQPFEVIIIVGAAFGAFIIGTPKNVLFNTPKALGAMMGGSPYSKANFIELLSVLYSIFKLAKTKGMLALESHTENPHESELFHNFPHFHKQHHAVEFLCDYLRLITLGSDNPHQMEDLMNEELDIHHKEGHKQSHAIQSMADGMPALGIVAAVLGVIHTMGAIAQPPEVLGHLIGAALVGTFLGVFISYGFLAPMASSIGGVYDEESRYYECIKVAILAYLNGYAPAICVEFARKSIIPDMRPTFNEVEEAVSTLPSFN
ncbi:MAG: flagellar motor stator protein MotA [Alphaproteobacteria bacterium]|nr:flagellar motor stator protein MotA [Alphaproteobacteria bacterium]